MKGVLGADSSGWGLSNSVEILLASGLSDPKGSRGLWGALYSTAGMENSSIPKESEHKSHLPPPLRAAQERGQNGLPSGSVF